MPLSLTPTKHHSGISVTHRIDQWFTLYQLQFGLIHRTQHHQDISKLSLTTKHPSPFDTIASSYRPYILDTQADKVTHQQAYYQKSWMLPLDHDQHISFMQQQHD